MNYSLMPSLQRAACIKIAIALWNKDDIGALTGGFNFKFLNTTKRQKEWLEVEEKVTKNVKELPLPDLQRKEVLHFIKPIGFEILKWGEYHQRCCLGRHTRYIRYSLNKLCWTPQGSVDRMKTAEALIRDENLGIRKRYKLACIYCLKDDILSLWNKMPEYYKKAFYSKDRIALEQDKIVVFWTRNLKRNVTRRECMGGSGRNHRCTTLLFAAFKYAVVHGNKVATEYLWQHLHCELRNEFLIDFNSRLLHRIRYNFTGSSDLFDFGKEEDSAGVLFFLLSQMNEEQQLRVFQEHPHYVLRSLLKWPWQDFFMETVKHVWAFLSKYQFYSILAVIIDNITVDLKDYNYQGIFTEFWQKSPVTLKEYAMYECVGGMLFLKIFLKKDMENIKILLDGLTVLDREKLIFSSEGKTICDYFIYNKEMDLLEFFVQECISSKDVMIKFRDEFERYTILSLSKEDLEERDMWNKSFLLLNDLAQKYNKKRRVEEGYNDPKRLCSLRSK